MVQPKYYKSKSVPSATSFEISNQVALCKLLDPINKILTVK